jgi:NAD-dependent deacetylase
MKDIKILIFTGAGVSTESGVETFRTDSNGLWLNHKVEDIATPEGWKKDREKVLNFYNERRRQLKNVSPNLAHDIIADLEKEFDTTVITQNVDDLHERAGSKNVIHLHGELKKVRSTLDPTLVYDWSEDCNIGDKCEKGSQLRHNICFFDEELNPYLLKRAVEAAREADVCIIVGTSMNVAPANMIPLLTKDNCLLYYVDPNDWLPPKQKRPFYTHIKKPATVGMKIVRDELIEIFK